MITTPIKKLPTLQAAPSFTWDAPDDSLLEDRRGALPAFPDDVFPPGLSKWLSRASRGAGTPIDSVAVPLLGVVSALIGRARCVRASSSWIEPLTLWTCVIGASGDRKTPGLRVLTRALDKIQEENKPQYVAAKIKHLDRIEQAKAAMKRWRKECADATDKNTESPPMPIEECDPGDFVFPEIYVSDSTVQRLARVCAMRQRGMLQVRDELTALFSGLTSAGSRAFYLEAWNGGKFVVERVDRYRVFTVENLLIGLTGGFQPDRLARAFDGDEDGMYGRFLYGWPATPRYAPLSDSIGEIDPEFQTWLMKLVRLPTENLFEDRGESPLPNDITGAMTSENFVPRTIPLSSEAREVFEDYRRFVDRTKRSTEGREAQWLSKSETHVLRLAGVLAYLDWAIASPGVGLESIAAALEPNEIDPRFMVAAVKLVREYFWLHAKAALRQIGLTDRHRHIRRVLRWARANERDEVSLKDIRREALSGSIDVEGARDLVERMIAAGWLRAEEVEQTGGRPKQRWAVNPQLFKAAETAESAGSLSAVPAVPATAKTTKRRQV
jgi:Protein of unknown function (DUF3987)